MIQTTRWLYVVSLGAALSMFSLASLRAELVPAGDFRGKSLEAWTQDWSKWSVRTGLAGENLPNTFDGVRYLPPNFGQDITADITIPLGTPLVFSPFFIFGENYDDGTDDIGAIPILPGLFASSSIKTTLNGAIVLEGAGNTFPDRLTAIETFAAPITYVTPQPRGGHNAVAAIFSQGIGAIFDQLPLGSHTIQNMYNAPDLGQSGTSTYRITVVPEPAMLGGVSALALVLLRRRRCAVSRL